MGPGEPFENTEIEILLVEDNEGDARLVKEAFKTSKFPWHLTVVQDGVEALMCLNGLGRYAGGEKPKLVLLDLKLPKLNGFEVLAEMRRNLSLKKIPVIILTGSQSEEDMEEAHKLEA
ncbi:MAG TPA: response regulator, partial [bacterium]|nr:response regulator [bacterium]